MSAEQSYREQYEAGSAIFLKLFYLTKEDFIKAMKSIFCEDERVMEVLNNNPRVIKKITDDDPETIEVLFYSSIQVSYLGIVYKPEYGKGTMLRRFDKFFNVDAALNGLSH